MQLSVNRAPGFDLHQRARCPATALSQPALAETPVWFNIWSQKSMKIRYLLFRRGRTFYVEDTLTGKQESLRTRDFRRGANLVGAKNEAVRQPFLNLRIAQTYLAASDPGREAGLGRCDGGGAPPPNWTKPDPLCDRVPANGARSHPPSAAGGDPIGPLHGGPAFRHRLHQQLPAAPP